MDQNRYIYVILHCLDEHHGSARLNPTVYNQVFDAIRADLTASDLGPTDDGR